MATTLRHRHTNQGPSFIMMAAATALIATIIFAGFQFTNISSNGQASTTSTQTVAQLNPAADAAVNGSTVVGSFQGTGTQLNPAADAAVNGSTVVGSFQGTSTQLNPAADAAVNG